MQATERKLRRTIDSEECLKEIAERSHGRTGHKFVKLLTEFFDETAIVLILRAADEAGYASRSSE